MFVTHESHQTHGATHSMREDRTSRAMRILMLLDASITYKMMQLFLTVADAHPKGVIQADLVGKIDPDRQNVSRWVMRFGEKPYMRLNNPSRSIALGLIRAQVGAYDQRTKVLTLTPKGVRVKQQIDGGEVQHEAS